MGSLQLSSFETLALYFYALSSSFTLTFTFKVPDTVCVHMYACVCVHVLLFMCVLGPMCFLTCEPQESSFPCLSSNETTSKNYHTWRFCIDSRDQTKVLSLMRQGLHHLSYCPSLVSGTFYHILPWISSIWCILYIYVHFSIQFFFR